MEIKIVRVTLIKTVLGSLPLYYLSLFWAPIKVLHTLENIRRCFFWGFKDESKGLSWVKWESVLSGKHKRGLGIGSLKAKNLSLVGKWKWIFHVDNESLWCEVLKAIHGPNGGFGVHSTLVFIRACGLILLVIVTQ